LSCLTFFPPPTDVFPRIFFSPFAPVCVPSIIFVCLGSLAARFFLIAVGVSPLYSVSLFSTSLFVSLILTGECSRVFPRPVAFGCASQLDFFGDVHVHLEIGWYFFLFRTLLPIFLLAMGLFMAGVLFFFFLPYRRVFFACNSFFPTFPPFSLLRQAYANAPVSLSSPPLSAPNIPLFRPPFFSPLRAPFFHTPRTSFFFFSRLGHFFPSFYACFF